MPTINVSSYLPNLLGPVAIKVAGVAQEARATINFTGCTAADDGEQLTIAASVGATPSGTGLRKVVAGVEAGAAATLVNADVDAAAAIAGSKVSPDFSTQTAILGGVRKTSVTNSSTGAINDLALAATTSIIVFSGAGAVTLSGVASGSEGRELTIINNTGNTITIPDSSVLSVAANRFRSAYAASTVMQDGVAVDFVYSTATNKWHTKLSF
jgi:hypothetical protein